MATIVPRTVIIKSSIDLKRPFIDNGGGYEAAAQALAKQDDFLDCDEQNCSARKRRRLTMLSAEERLLRRKLKNRVAAQVARDKKKEKMTELELMIDNLEKQNQLLRRENQDLKDEVKKAKQETDQLRCRLHDKTTRSGKDEVTESAALKAPLPKDLKPLPLLQLVTHVLATITTLSLIYCNSSSMKSQISQNLLKHSLISKKSQAKSYKWITNTADSKMNLLLMLINLKNRKKKKKK